MPSKKTDQTANDDIFDQTAAPAANDAADREAALAATIDNGDDPFAEADKRRAAGEPPIEGIDFEQLRQRQAEMRAAQAASGDDSAPAGDGDGNFFINMAEADKRLEPMPIGTRLVVSCSAAEAKVAGSGNPMISLRVKVERVVSTPLASTDTRSFKNRTLRDNLMFIPPDPDRDYRGTIWRSNGALKAFGVEPDKGVYRTKAAFMAMLQAQADRVRGCVAEVEVGIELNDGSNGKQVSIDPASGEAYGPKNTIARYYPYKPPIAASVADDSDDLPF